MSGSDPRSSVILADLMRGTGFEVGMLDGLANEIEEMAKLLHSMTERL
jgi:hypothetical protein